MNSQFSEKKSVKNVHELTVFTPKKCEKPESTRVFHSQYFCKTGFQEGFTCNRQCSVCITPAALQTLTMGKSTENFLCKTSSDNFVVQNFVCHLSYVEPCLTTFICETSCDSFVCRTSSINFLVPKFVYQSSCGKLSRAKLRMPPF